MGGAVDGGEAGRVDVGVALRRRQRGVAQKLLDGPEIAAGAQKMGGEGMTQRVWRHAFGEAETAPYVTDALLHDGGIERAAAGADEEGLARTTGRQPGTSIAIDAQGVERLRQQRHEARLVALAGDGERVAAGLQQVLDDALGEAERLADAQPRA